uniref:Uncharacterized protein n=1 Tax=Panagrolaimus sp. PS1159 TaxID=55785 RepID=A0AC35EZV8_9BILA
MLLLNIIKVFLLQAFFVSNVYASFVATKAIFYNKTNFFFCISLTWLPFDVQVPNCEKDSNPFAGERIDQLISNDIHGCRHFFNQSSIKNETVLPFIFGDQFDNETLHQLSTLCSETVCNDLEPEVNLDQFWRKIVTKNRTKEFCQTYSNDTLEFKCPFSGRLDIQHYIYNKSLNNQNDGTIDDENLCIDRFGRKYPPPVGLGGKCVAFLREFQKDDKRITEFFMPFDKRDLVQRIAQYPYTHVIRTNSTTLNRLLPHGVTPINETGCLTIHYNTSSPGVVDMLFHCVYDPHQSKFFKAEGPNDFYCPKNEHVTLYKGPNDFYCPKNEHVTLYSNMSMNKPFETIYTYHPISDEFFEFAETCYASFLFTPIQHEIEHWDNRNVPFEMNMTLMGKTESNCSIKHSGGNNPADYMETMFKVMDNTCPWDRNMSYTICFELPAKEIMTHWNRLYSKLNNLAFFDQCHYQSPTSKYGCYIIVDPMAKMTFRLPPKWVRKLENNELIISPKVDWSKNGTSSAFVYFTAVLKEECLAKLDQMKESPVPKYDKDKLQNYYKFNTKSFVVKCEETFCDIPVAYNPITTAYETKNIPGAVNWTTEMETLNQTNPLICSYGISDKSLDTVIINSSWTFFCSIQLSIYYEHGQKLRRYTFSNNLTTFVPPPNKEFTPKDCWTSEEFAMKINSDIDKEDVTPCYHEGEIYKCCCRASKEPCNVAAIIDKYQEIAETDKTEKQRRIGNGCDFKTQVSTTTTETCSKDFVRNDREMRCYGIFNIPQKANNNHAKPTLVKENCYWPHPQYHDEYSIFCSKQLFSVNDDKCLTSFINDFTSKSNSTKEKKFDRTLILCCNTGVYPNKRESILSRSFVLL